MLNNIDDFNILDEIKTVPSPKTWISTAGITLMEGAAFAGMMVQRTNIILAILLWIVSGMSLFVMMFVPNMLRYKEVAGRLYIDTQTHFADDDIYELLVLEDVETVIEPREPFPFAEIQYTEEELIDSFEHIGGQILTDDLIADKLEIERDTLKELLREKQEHKSRWRRKRGEIDE